MSESPPNAETKPDPEVHRYGGFTRFVVVAAGALVFVGCGLLIVLFAAIAWTWRNKGLFSSGGPWPVVLLGMAFAVPCGWGVALMARGLRGSTRISEASRRRNRFLTGMHERLGLGITFLGVLGLVFVPPSETTHLLRSVSFHLIAFSIWSLLIVPLHEGGHVLGALLARLPIRSVQVFRLVWERGAFHFRRPLEQGTKVVAEGRVRLECSIFGVATWRGILFVVAGPLANLLTAAVLGSLWLSPWISGSQWLAPFCGLGSLMNAGLGLMNLCFFQIGSLVSDGQMLRALWTAKRFSPSARVLAVSDMLLETLRPRDLGLSAAELLELAERDPEHRGWLWLHAVCIELDRGDHAGARHIFDLARPQLEALAGSTAMELELQEVMLSALLLADPVRARSCWSAGVGATMEHEVYPRLAEAALLVAEGRLDEARVAYGEWTAHVKTVPGAKKYPKGNQWAIERLELALGTHVEGPLQAA